MKHKPSSQNLKGSIIGQYNTLISQLVTDPNLRTQLSIGLEAILNEKLPKPLASSLEDLGSNLFNKEYHEQVLEMPHHEFLNSLYKQYRGIIPTEEKRAITHYFYEIARYLKDDLKIQKIITLKDVLSFPIKEIKVHSIGQNTIKIVEQFFSENYNLNLGKACYK